MHGIYIYRNIYVYMYMYVYLHGSGEKMSQIAEFYLI